MILIEHFNISTVAVEACEFSKNSRKIIEFYILNQVFILTDNFINTR